MSSWPVLSLVTFLPLLGAGIIFCITGRKEMVARNARWAALWVSLFTFAAYLGTVGQIAPNGWTGALICLLAVFAPSFLLVAGTLPFWDALRGRPTVRRALMGINAAVVGLLLAALYDPVWTSAILRPADLALALAALAALAVWKLPPWLVVLATAAGGWGLAAAIPAL